MAATTAAANLWGVRALNNNVLPSATIAVSRALDREASHGGCQGVWLPAGWRCWLHSSLGHRNPLSVTLLVQSWACRCPLGESGGLHPRASPVSHRWQHLALSRWAAALCVPTRGCLLLIHAMLRCLQLTLAIVHGLTMSTCGEWDSLQVGPSASGLERTSFAASQVVVSIDPLQSLLQRRVVVNIQAAGTKVSEIQLLSSDHIDRHARGLRRGGTSQPSLRSRSR